jgi:hypothetical protein
MGSSFSDLDGRLSFFISPPFPLTRSFYTGYGSFYSLFQFRWHQADNPSDASVTQSALEEALASNMQAGGGMASRMSTISHAFKSRYL